MDKLVLANPPLFEKERYGLLAPAGACVPPLALCSLGAVCRARGWKVRIIDVQAERLTLAQAAEHILAEKPDFLGISITTSSVDNAAALTRIIKSKSNAKVIVGGPHVSSLPEQTIEEYSEFDAAVIGEGEETLLELLSVLQNAGNLGNVQGIVYRDNKRTVRTGPRPFIKDLDQLPAPAWDLLSNFPSAYHVQLQGERVRPSISIVTSRGCSGRCTFCDRSVFGNVCRAHSAEYVVDLISELRHKYKVKHIQFEDDNFTLFPKRVERMCDLLLARRLGVSWSCLSRVDTVSFDLFKKMKAAGCWTVMFGIESGSQAILQNLNKGIKIENVYRTVELARKAGLITKGFFIIGSPGENVESLDDTLNLMLRSKLDDISITYFTPFPGSAFYQDASMHGKITGNWEDMTFYKPVFLPAGLSEKELQTNMRRMYLRFYLRPRVVCSYLFRIRSWSFFIALLKSVFALLLYFGGRSWGRPKKSGHTVYQEE